VELAGSLVALGYGLEAPPEWELTSPLSPFKPAWPPLIYDGQSLVA